LSKRINILGSNIDALTMDETIAKVEELIEARRYTQHVVVNAGKINLMQKDKNLRKIVNTCPLINADGMSVVWASKFLGKSLPERVAGIDLFDNLVRISEEKEYKLYFFGAKQEVVEKVVEIYKEKYPRIKVVGCRNGYFKDDESMKIAEEIRDAKPDILFVAFSSPQKEYWINEYLEVMQVPFVMGVGGSFDVVAGKTKRAPVWMQDMGLEWFYRFLQEPGRMWKRYLVGNTQFMNLVLKERFLSRG